MTKEMCLWQLNVTIKFAYDKTNVFITIECDNKICLWQNKCAYDKTNVLMTIKCASDN